MTSNQIAINGTRALDLPADYVPVAGYEGLDPDDFSLPTLKLVQAQTTLEGAEKHQGEYVKTDTVDYFKDPQALIVGIQKSRIMFPSEYGGAASDPLCRSDDSYRARNEYIGTDVEGVEIPPACADCPFSKWTDNQAPRCTLSENWAAILDTQDIVILRLKGTSAAASKILKNMMRANRLKRRSTYVQLGSTFTRSDKGQYYVATVKSRTETPPIDSLDLARELASVNLAARAADEAPEPRPAPASAGHTDWDDQPPTDGDDLPF